MRNLFLGFALLLTCLISEKSFAGFEGLNKGQSLKLFNRINCGDGITCTKTGNMFTVTASGEFESDITGDGSQKIVGFAQNQVAATATTATAAQCGSTFINSGAVQIDLPVASTVLGCRYTFVTGNASNFDVNPAAADQILVQTNAVGDSIRNATLGNTITLQAVAANSWAVVGILGTWADND